MVPATCSSAPLARDLPPKAAPIYAHMLVGMVALAGEWWQDRRTITKAEVAAHVVNLAWNDLAVIEVRPTLSAAEG